MATTEEIRRIVEKHWPEYVEVAGKQYTAKIVEAVAEGRDRSDLFSVAQGGDKFDFLPPLEALAAAAGIVQAAFEIYDRLKGFYGRKPSKEEVTRELTGTAAAPPEVASEVSKVAESIVESDRDPADS